MVFQGPIRKFSQLEEAKEEWKRLNDLNDFLRNHKVFGFTRETLAQIKSELTTASFAVASKIAEFEARLPFPLSFLPEVTERTHGGHFVGWEVSSVNAHSGFEYILPACPFLGARDYARQPWKKEPIIVVRILGGFVVLPRRLLENFFEPITKENKANLVFVYNPITNTEQEREFDAV